MLQLVPVLYTGGLEHVATRLTLDLSGRVGAVAMCTHGGDPFEPVLRSAGIEIVGIARPKTSRPVDMLRATTTVARTLRSFAPHVVHAHNPTAGIVATSARRLAGRGRIAIVTTYHGVTPHRVGRAVRALSRASDVVVGVGPASTRALVAAGLDPAHARTIFNAVEPSDVDASATAAVRSELAGDGELVVTVGRYVPEKDHALLLDAVALLAPRRPRLRVAIVGVGPLEADLRARTRALALDAVVTITGERRDAATITAAADAFVLSSSSEGLPIALLEAMAASVPVVTTAVGGVGDAVRDGETGLLVRHGDAAALAAAIESVLDDRALASRLAANARVFVAADCSPQAMLQHYLDVYLDVVDGRA
ncbi:MAG TPA: glycosyltransferase [Gaiellaceae bacterium]